MSAKKHAGSHKHSGSHKHAGTHAKKHTPGHKPPKPKLSKAQRIAMHNNGLAWAKAGRAAQAKARAQGKPIGWSPDDVQFCASQALAAVARMNGSYLDAVALHYEASHGSDGPVSLEAVIRVAGLSATWLTAEKAGNGAIRVLRFGPESLHAVVLDDGGFWSWDEFYTLDEWYRQGFAHLYVLPEALAVNWR